MEIEDLKKVLKGKVIIVGVGNILRGDDGAGPELIRRLKNSLLSTRYSLLYLIDAGEVPENYLQKIVEHKPDTILLVDAVDFGSPPGSIEFIDPNRLKEGALSTHNASLKLTIEYLTKSTGADILLLGIQPKDLKMGSGRSGPVKGALDKIQEWLVRCTNWA